MIFDLNRSQTVFYLYITAKDQCRYSGKILFLAEYDVLNLIGLQNMILVLQPDIVGLDPSLHIKGCNDIYRHMIHPSSLLLI
jgi:hypothetical protein